ncbi:MAG: efflux RND transporter periplasmic adaptor subunit [Chthoniobacter sp.]|uniref:efflux RND transporter periplasmic adaptor subunit n=1 Tax=Chthoniobacter sp. TaxID=2510640 RepID=UPI0032A25C92
MKINPSVFAALAPLLLLAACKKDHNAGPAAPPEVLVITAAAKDVPVYREWVGTLDGSENAQIRARVVGYLLKRDYQEGGTVKKGDVLFEIDARPFEAAYAEAKSQLVQGKAVQLATQSDADRNKELFARKVISEQEFTNKTQQNEANIAKVQALQATVEEAQLNVQFCQVISPVNGIAGNAMAQVGDLVGQGTNAVLTTVSTVDPIKMLFPISEQEYLESAEKIEQALAKPFEQREELFEVILANGEIFEHKGRLLSLDRQVNQATGTILATALLDNPNGLLRPGQFARARIKAMDLPAAIVVPQRAVAELQGTYQVGVVGADNKAEIRTVTVGPRFGSEWAIASGLKPGEKVVVEGYQKLRAGAPVIPKPWTPPAPAAKTEATKPADAPPKTEAK